MASPGIARLPSAAILLLANAALLVGALFFVFSIQSSSVTIRAGQVAAETVVAQNQVTYPDRIATEGQRKLAMAAVQVSYRTDPRAAELRRREAAAFLPRVREVLASNASLETKQAAIRQLLPTGASTSAFQQLYSLSDQDLKMVSRYSLNLLTQAEAWHFASYQLQSTALALLSTIPPQVSLPQRTAVGEMLATFLQPTQLPDYPGTLQKRKEAAARVGTIYSTLEGGQVVVRRGDLVTPTIIEQLSALGLQGHHTDWHDLAASALYALVIITILFWYLHSFHPQIVANPRLLLLLDLSILITVAAARLLGGGHVLLPYLLPVAATSTFAAVLIAPEACIAMSLTMAVLAGWVVANSFELTMYYFISGAAGVLAVREVRQLKQFIIAGLYITGFALATALAFGLLNHQYDFAAFREYMLAAACNGFVSSALALGGFALISGYFGVTTNLQLFELAQPNQPLLRRLTQKAPGTYNHSLIVSNMVEQAAEAIGANSLVARVSALYHDVGKTANPHCFVENQMGMTNIHDELRSDESARLIRGHVTQGLRLAHQFRLPRPILDAIAEHHGTMTLIYFLQKARQEVQGTPVDLSVYSYPGPRPQTKETALLMLADGCESAVRAGSDHSADRIKDVIEGIFQERMQQHQLDECPLTLHDLDRVKRVYALVLNGLYHPRIEYPDSSETEAAEIVTELRPASALHGRG